MEEGEAWHPVPQLCPPRILQRVGAQEYGTEGALLPLTAFNRHQLPYREAWHCFPAVSYLCVFRLPLKMGQLTPRSHGARAKLPNPSSTPFQAPEMEPNLVSFPVLVTTFPTPLW